MSLAVPWRLAYFSGYAERNLWVVGLFAGIGKIIEQPFYSHGPFRGRLFIRRVAVGRAKKVAVNVRRFMLIAQLSGSSND